MIIVVLDDLEEERLVDAVFGGGAWVDAVAHDGVTPRSAAELVADVLDCGLQEVDSGVGAGDAVHDCAAGPDGAFGEGGAELSE